MKLSFVCCYNNISQLDDMLLRSIRTLNGKVSDCDINTLLIDSKALNFRSAAQAYNEEIKKHREEIGDILVFCHQDIAFDDYSFLERIITELSRNPNQIIGVAGMPKTGRTISNLRYFKTKKYITLTRVKETTPVDSVDECLFAMTQELYDSIRFDERTCDNWHLYAVDFCYEAKRRLGTQAVVIPEDIYHKDDSNGGMYSDNKFLKTLCRMREKYKNDIDSINTPCYRVSTSVIPFYNKLLRTYIKNVLHERVNSIIIK